MLFIIVSVVHVMVCLFLIVVVLLQHGKSADVAAAFGGMASQTAFGPRGAATVLSKATTWSAIVFMLTSITLSILAYKQPSSGRSVMEGVKTTEPQKTQPAPSTPAQPRPAPPAK